MVPLHSQLNSLKLLLVWSNHRSSKLKKVFVPSKATMSYGIKLLILSRLMIVVVSRDFHDYMNYNHRNLTYFSGLL